jgi:PLP dependent protein
MLRENLKKIEERLDKALLKCGRRREEITLIAVTKKFPAERVREAYEVGLRDFGENYVQEFEAKSPFLADLAGSRSHLIGHLQSNKAKRAAELFHVIQTVDSGKLARRLNENAPSGLDVMVEVKLSPEDAKAGTAPEDIGDVLDAIRQCPQLRLRGLMTMPPWIEDPEQVRPYFARLRQLAAEHGVSGLSMGMSHDFEAAVEEGATHIRIGTALFGPRQR